MDTHEISDIQNRNMANKLQDKDCFIVMADGVR